TGTNFNGTSEVYFDGSARSAVLVSSTELTATIPASDLTTAGTYDITVVNPAPGGGTSDPQTFTVIAPNPVPTTVSISPDNKNVGDSEFTLTVTGTNFNGTSEVYFDGSARSAVLVSSTELTATIPASDLTTAGTYDITVVNPAPGGGPSNAQVFTVEEVNFLEQDSLALVALYNSTNGASWTDNTNWLTTASLNTWNGITVSQNRVQQINLDSNNLTGSLPVGIGNISDLRYLSLRFNNLSGSIPNEIGQLLNLQVLNLVANEIVGTLPVDIGNLTDLNYLNIADNNLSGEIPHEIGLLNSLTDLYLSLNNFSGPLPVEIGNLTNLRFLYLGTNNISGLIPIEISYLSNLQRLYLESNQLTGAIPIEIGNLTSLQIMNLYNNNLTGSVPVQFGNIINLQELNLGWNNLSGNIPTQMSNLVNLQQVYLDSNNFVGSIPAGFGSLPSLAILLLSNNQFDGLPIFTSTSLNQLIVDGNKLTFEDLEPNIGVPNQVFAYSPQDSVGISLDTTIQNGSSFLISVIIGGTANQYQWFKDNIAIPGATNTVYQIISATQDDVGIYTCEITNTIATALTLHRRPIAVQVEIDYLKQDSLALIALYDSTGGP
ncbi:MAG: hypothetical protein GY808_07860, partial [Gammaproteobacteria bacterium]|nr:hypothetical protein [Gammaproteobacteria bacterium]